jgi:hypothetical protein
LGSSLKGGEEKIEEVRLGLLSFRREVDGLKDGVTQRRAEVEQLYKERIKVAREIRRGRALVEVNTRLEELEGALRVGTNGNRNAPTDGDLAESDFTESDDSEDEDDISTTISTTRLQRQVQQYATLTRLISKVGAAHPFLVKQQDRVARIRQTILLDMKNALVESRKGGAGNGKSTLRVMALYSALDEPQEGIIAAKDQKR